jgi:hypothetical protein
VDSADQELDADQALDALATLSQGRGVSVQAYAASFRTLLARSQQVPDYKQARAFMRGLREQRIKDELMLRIWSRQPHRPYPWCDSPSPFDYCVVAL